MVFDLDARVGQTASSPEKSVLRIREKGHTLPRLADAVTAAQTLLEQAQTAGPKAYPGAAYNLAMGHWLLGRMLNASGNAEAALLLLAEARTHFARLAEASDSSAARMVSVCMTASGDSLKAMGRLDAAAAAYEMAIQPAEQQHNLRQVATGKFQLGTVRRHQGNYAAALTACTEARDTFAHLGEPTSVAVAWHQVGVVHTEAGQYTAAEHAYQESLRMMTQMGNTAGQADTLTGLGALYAAMYRLEDAVRFSLQAAKLYDTLGDQIGEGRARNNAASLLNALGRHDDARRELQRAIACLEPFGHAATPWTTFNNLHDLERAVGNPTAAATARQRALDSYLAYRRADGVSQSSLAELYILVAQALATHQHAEATSALTALAQEPDLPPYVPPVLTALQAMLAGARDPALADDPNLGYDDAAELRLLLEQCSTA